MIFFPLGCLCEKLSLDWKLIGRCDTTWEILVLSWAALFSEMCYLPCSKRNLGEPDVRVLSYDEKKSQKSSRLVWFTWKHVNLLSNTRKEMIVQHSLCITDSPQVTKSLRTNMSFEYRSGNKLPASHCMKIVGICNVNTLVAFLTIPETCFWFESIGHLSRATSAIEIEWRSYLHANARLSYETLKCLYIILRTC